MKLPGFEISSMPMSTIGVLKVNTIVSYGGLPGLLGKKLDAEGVPNIAPEGPPMSA